MWSLGFFIASSSIKDKSLFQRKYKRYLNMFSLLPCVFFPKSSFLYFIFLETGEFLKVFSICQEGWQQYSSTHVADHLDMHAGICF